MRPSNTVVAIHQQLLQVSYSTAMSACREAEFLVLLWGSARNKTELEAVCRHWLLPKVNIQDSPEVGKWPIVLDLLHAMEADSWLHTADFGFDQFEDLGLEFGTTGSRNVMLPSVG